jgi:hypothetical protein
MSNSSRIEAATRKHVNETLNNNQIIELVRAADPNWKGGVYPSDAAYKRTPEGLVPRGKVAYGDGVLEYLGENSFKVLADKEIVRRPSTRKAAVVPPAAPETKPVAATPAASGKKEAAKTTPAKPPATPKSKGADRHAAV